MTSEVYHQVNLCRWQQMRVARILFADINPEIGQFMYTY
jgi:hypothetical protein